MQFIELAKLLLSLLPAIIQAVTAIEAAMPEGGNGAAKLAMVKSALETAYEYSGKIGDLGAIWNPVEKVIGAIVGTFNSTGAFKK